MTWGSNATYTMIRCQYCGVRMLDDRDEGPATHMLSCTKRPWSRKVVDWFRPPLSTTGRGSDDA